MAEKSKYKKSNGEQSDLRDLERHFENTNPSPPLLDHLIWLQIWCPSWLWGKYLEGRRFGKTELLIQILRRGIEEFSFLFILQND